jgi:hypothetical protein
MTDLEKDEIARKVAGKLIDEFFGLAFGGGIGCLVLWAICRMAGCAHAR